MSNDHFCEDNLDSYPIDSYSWHLGQISLACMIVKNTSLRNIQLPVKIELIDGCADWVLQHECSYAVIPLCDTHCYLYVYDPADEVKVETL